MYSMEYEEDDGREHSEPCQLEERGKEADFEMID